MEKLLIDSVVLINWLTQETETASGRELWVAPATIMELGESEHTLNYVSLISLLEVRFVLRRKKKHDDIEIANDLQSLEQIIHLVAPDEVELEQANQLQSEHALDPFDSILLSQAITLRGTLITRDQRLLTIAESYICGYTPERYIEHLLHG